MERGIIGCMAMVKLHIMQNSRSSPQPIQRTCIFMAVKGGMGRSADQLKSEYHVEDLHYLSTLTSKFQVFLYLIY